MLDKRSLVGAIVATLLVLAAGCREESRPRAARAASPPPDPTVVARVGDETITLGDVDEKAIAANMSTYQELYNARRAAAEELVADRLLEKEAAARGMTKDELVEKEIASKIEPVSDADVERFFLENRQRLGGRTLDQIGGQIRDYLEAQNERRARDELVDELKEKAGVTITLAPPRVPIVVAADEPAAGPAEAEVVIVEYSDFQ